MEEEQPATLCLSVLPLIAPASTLFSTYLGWGSTSAALLDSVLPWRQMPATCWRLPWSKWTTLLLVRVSVSVSLSEFQYTAQFVIAGLVYDCRPAYNWHSPHEWMDEFFYVYTAHTHTHVWNKSHSQYWKWTSNEQELEKTEHLLMMRLWRSTSCGEVSLRWT